MVPLDEGGRGRGADRPMRAPKGPSFAMPTALATGIVAGILAFAGVLAVSQLAGPKDGPEQDAGGVAAARLLAARDMDSWSPDFGTLGQVHDRVKAAIAKQREIVEKNDSRDTLVFDEAVDQWMNGTFPTKSPWIPGLNKILGEAGDAKLEDATIVSARKRGMESATQNDGTLIGAVVFDNANHAVASTGAPYNTTAAPARTYGSTNVYVQADSNGKPIRIYEHPVLDRSGTKAGRALVCVASAPPPDLIGSAAAGAGLAFLGGFIVAFIMSLGPVKALRKLAVESDALARGEFQTRVSTRGPDVIAAVAKNVQRLAALAADGTAGAPQVVHQAVEVLPLADIQTGLAPLRSVDRPNSLEIEATSKTCPQAGNDYYDVIRIDEDHTGFFIADIPLHGVAGAMYMAQVRALFRAEAVHDASPSAVLREVNRAFARDLPRGIYVTALYVVIEHSTGIGRFASAGHLPLVFWKREKKGSAKVAGEGIALGLDAGPVFDKTLAEKAVQLDLGDRLVLYTDGAINAKNASGATYGEEKFYYVVNREAPKNSAAFVNFVANDVDLFHAGAPQLDDFTILTARRTA